MIAPTPPAANLHSQLMRVCVSEPSSLSNRPEMFERKTRFFTVRLRNWSGVKMTSSPMTRASLTGPPAASFPHGAQQGGNERGRGTLRPMSDHEFDVGAAIALARGVELEHDERARTHRASHGGARHGRLPQHARRREQALRDHGVGRGPPARLRPQLAHALEAANKIVHGNAVACTRRDRRRRGPRANGASARAYR